MINFSQSSATRAGIHLNDAVNFMFISVHVKWMSDPQTSRVMDETGLGANHLAVYGNEHVLFANLQGY